ncbi:uncharacterized protein LOC123678668 [Harmonia axyridis]|uniref:uncharacterized protein LOC123678668 n=1 Tax=Harmonia axyridis TaxID=115357 RepID=UPI001E2790D4|nr:uncharacterized protein LOC123678668 [Harmonia axyridis]
MKALHILAQKAKTDRTQHVSFKVRYQDIQTIHDEFFDHHNKVIFALLTDPESDLKPENLIRQSFLSDYYDVKTCFTELFDEYVSSPSGPSHNSTMLGSPANHGNIRLLKISLMKFSGDYKDFTSFRDQFDALVHNNPSLTPIEKFTYLVSSVQGSALSLVKTLPSTSPNYVIAYKSIVERFSNRRTQSQSLWTEIENAPKITVPSAKSYRKLIDTFTENVAALNNLKFPTDSWNFILVMMIIKRLDKNTLTRFEMEHQSNEVPAFSEVIDFINRHCLVLETLGSSTLPTMNDKQNTMQKSASFIRPASSRTTAFFVNKSPAATCIFCQANHSLYTCSTFANKPVSDGYHFCKVNKLCFNCLSSSHDLRSCRSCHTCKVCKSTFHHTLLHDNTKLRSANASSSSPSAISAMSNGQKSFLSQANSNRPDNDSTFVGAGVMALPSHVHLSTAYVDVCDGRGAYQSLKCLIDSDSMTCFITEKAVGPLNLRKVPNSVEVRGMGSMNTKLSGGSVSLSLKPEMSNNPISFTDAIVVDKICENLPVHPVFTNS